MIIAFCADFVHERNTQKNREPSAARASAVLAMHEIMLELYKTSLTHTDTGSRSVTKKKFIIPIVN